MHQLFSVGIRILRFSLAINLVSLATAFAQTAAPVAVVTPTMQAVFREVKITGTVTSPRVARLSTSLAGLIVGLSVDEGDLVEKGQSLLMLDAELAEYELASAKAGLQQSETALADARRRLKESESLGPRGGIAETLIGDLRSEVAQDEAELSQSKAQADYQQALLARYQLKAPFAGIISQRDVELGEWVTPGQGVLELVAMDALRLDFAIAEDFLGQISTGAEVTFQLNSAPTKSFVGRITAVVPVTDPGARTFLVRVIPSRPVAELMPGMSVTAVLRIATNRQALVVPRDAILRYSDGRVVAWVVTKKADGLVASERRVTLDQAFDGVVAVLSGIEAGESVVVEGNESLQNGQSVQVVPSSKGE